MGSHPHLCDGCKQQAGAAAVAPAARTREHSEPERGGVGQYDFRRNTRRPVCAQCGADFTTRCPPASGPSKATHPTPS